MAEVRLLGPVILSADDHTVDLGPPKQRLVLAALAVDAGRPVPVETLVRRVWDDEPPVEARNALYAHIMRIRRALAAAEPDGPDPLRLRRTAAGYILDGASDSIDMLRFRRLVSRALRPEHGGSQRAAMLQEALDLWRGTPLADLSGSWVRRVRKDLAQQHRDALTAWGRAQLELGHHDVVIDRLRGEVEENPPVEPLTGVLMRALHAAGRTPEALDLYTAIRKRLIEELGTDPGPELQLLHQAILRGEPDPARAPAPPPAAVATPAAVPSQLPPAVPDFVGRSSEAAAIRAHLARADRGAPALVVISGMGGAGKTALAVTVARACQAAYPDGQLFVELRAGRSDPNAVLGSFLRALEVPPRSVPHDPDERIGLYRTVTAARRLLIVLDNAASEADVRPLLPGGASSAVIVTTRGSLHGLDGAVPVHVGELPAADGVELLTRVAGPDRIPPQLGEEVVRLCGGLPLALRIAAVRLRSNGLMDGAQLVGVLSDEHRRLDALRAGDRSVRASLALTYRRLAPPVRLLLQLLACAPGPDISAIASSALAPTTPDETRGQLEQLVDVHLVTLGSGSDGDVPRLRLHDLVRAYATEHSLAGTAAAVDTGVRRLLGWYVAAAAAAGEVLMPGRVGLDDVPAAPTGQLPRFDGQSAAAGWFATEQHVLLDAARYAARRGWHSEAWQLAFVQRIGLRVRFEIDEWVAISLVGISAAQALANPSAEGRLRSSLGTAYLLSARPEEALAQWHVSIGLHEAGGDLLSVARDEDSLGAAYASIGDLGRAEHHHLRALAIPEYAEHPGYSGHARINLGALYGDQGRFDDAERQFRHALDRATAGGDVSVMCLAEHNLAEVQLKLGRAEEAVRHAQAEIDLAHRVPWPEREARGWEILADATAETDPARATDARRKALAIYEVIDHARARKVEALLAATPVPRRS